MTGPSVTSVGFAGWVAQGVFWLFALCQPLCGTTAVLSTSWWNDPFSLNWKCIYIYIDPFYLHTFCTIFAIFARLLHYCTGYDFCGHVMLIRERRRHRSIDRSAISLRRSRANSLFWYPRVDLCRLNIRRRCSFVDANLIHCVFM